MQSYWMEHRPEQSQLEAEEWSTCYSRIERQGDRDGGADRLLFLATFRCERRIKLLYKQACCGTANILVCLETPLLLRVAFRERSMCYENPDPVQFAVCNWLHKITTFAKKVSCRSIEIAALLNIRCCGTPYSQPSASLPQMSNVAYQKTRRQRFTARMLQYVGCTSNCRVDVRHVNTRTKRPNGTYTNIIIYT
jgi:hypothetical protein